MINIMVKLQTSIVITPNARDILKRIFVLNEKFYDFLNKLAIRIGLDDFFTIVVLTSKILFWYYISTTKFYKVLVYCSVDITVLTNTTIILGIRNTVDF